MPRGPKIDREKVRQKILAAALDILKTNGVAGLNARAIAKHIGYAVGTIYNVFEDMDDITMNLNACTLDGLYAGFQEVLSHERSSYAALYALALRYIRFCQEEHHLWSLLFEYDRAARRILPVWYQEKINRLFSMVSEIVLPLAGDDKVKADQAARVLWAGLHGICSLAFSGRLTSVGTASATELADSLITCYLAGLRSNT